MSSFLETDERTVVLRTLSKCNYVAEKKTLTITAEL